MAKQERHSPAPAWSAQIQGLTGTPIALLDLLDNITFGLVVLDQNRKILAANRSFEALTGFSRDAVAGIPCRHILRTNFCSRSCPVMEARKNGQPATVEGDMIDRERRKIGIRVTAATLRDKKGRVCGFLETVEELRIPSQDAGSFGHAGLFSRILGQSPKMTEVFNILPAVAQTDSSVLITGETGTGKDLVAEAIHKASSRSRGPFIKINCGALPETLLESELFGHTKGAFTGAVSDKPGRLKMAHGGTLFLTEIGDLPLPLQVKLLTFLDDQIVYPLGAAKGFQAEVRVIAATHRHLEGMVRRGEFRQDLLFRLNVMRVQLPPLRHRNGDVKLLLDYFLTKFSQRFHKKVSKFSKEALQLLNSYAYPGNVREIRNIVEYAVGIVEDRVIGTEHLPAYLSAAPDDIPLPATDRDGRNDEAEETISAAARTAAARMDWSAVERTMILDALLQAKGKRAQAAEILGWGRSTLWRKMKHYGL